MAEMEKRRRPQAETCDSDCDYIHAHDDVIQSVYEEMPEEEVLYDLAELFKVFGDSTRIKILYVLFQSEMCVCDIAQLLNMSQSAISHQLYDLAELFKVFGDSTRIKILYVLFQSEMCVCDIAQLLNMSQSAISHQLRVLKQAQLVKYRREGKTVFYSLADSHVTTILNQGLEHIEE